MTEPVTTPPATPPAAPTTEPQTFSWKTNLNADMQNSTLLQKFDDNAEGLGKFAESHLNLEKLLGHEKVPIPKDANDTEGWSRFRKAMGIPESAGGYQLDDAQIPEAAKGMMFDKAQFAEIMAKNNATPAQAAALWKTYTEMAVNSYQKAMTEYQASIDASINKLRQEWGDAYDVNVELGQAVINKFSADQETNDFITSVLTQDPRGVKFLQQIGKQFAENNIGDFQVKRFSMSPAEAKAEWDKILADPNHPYSNPKATAQEHAAAVQQVNRLIEAANRVA